MYFPKRLTIYLLIPGISFFLSCNNSNGVKEKEIINDPGSMDAVVERNIESFLLSATENNGKIGDNLRLNFLPVLQSYYKAVNYQPAWSNMEKWEPRAGALLNYLSKAASDGLFREDYHFSTINTLKRLLEIDSVKRMDAVLWTKADLLYTDAFMHVIQDLKQGRLQPDSQAWKNNPVKYKIFFAANLDRLRKGESLDSILKSVQPTVKGYWALKNGINSFIEKMDTAKYTYVSYPYKTGDTEDSVLFVKNLIFRLGESGIRNINTQADSLQLTVMIKKYQLQKKITADGKISSALIRLLNTTDIERFKQIAITLDRFKQLPEKMPDKYIMVNIPAYNLQVWDTDTVVFNSKVICGKPATATPSITSAISDLVIYPTWTVPSSIIKKEMLPGLKRSSNYLARKGLQLFNYKGELIDPSKIDWTKYSKGIPYKIQQGSGDNNALGVIKFNFSNPFDVYLHDTNQRYLFKKAKRALSHGCVRVQEWEKLAIFIARNDSLQNEMDRGDTLRYNTDSILNWIAKKEKHRIDVKYKIPLFIRYFGCEGFDGTIKFYDDIYDEDKRLKEKYFVLK